MNKLLTVIAAAILFAGTASTQDKTAQYRKGWPSKDAGIDIREGFVNPPKGYGNVPFFWWCGDNLDLDRLTKQLEVLSSSATDGLCVSYNHSHPKVDVEFNSQGYGGFGKPESGTPYVLSADWMKLWADYSRRCADFGIGLGLDDYVVASPGNGGPVDEVLDTPSIKSFQGRLKRERFSKDGNMPDNILTTKDLGDSLEIIFTVPSPELHPDYGRLMVEKYFQPFEDSMDAKGRDGMNYFFQDELIYNLDMRSWCEGMPGIFKTKKGYDILPHLDALFATKNAEIDETAAKVRLDYAEVLTQLAEERYFKPIYDWHADRGLIYGCDNEGRGLDPVRYLDYFRAISWFTAPGNDAPARGSSFRQTKVSSSIAHLYGRPRTWLEAFHSMGWDANGGVLMHQLDHHLIAGGNLLCLHGLYYSTHGGWWEWAPPSFHFRMPYWPHMKTWLKYAERMSYILSQGVHVCDIAVLYPTETMQAFPEEKPDLTFKVALSLSDHGLDYDFIDWQSLQKADIREGALHVMDESYKVLILAGTRAMHEESEAKVKEFERMGGIVIRVDSEDVEGLVENIRGRIVPDFRTSSGTGKVLHRRIGDKEVYMVMDVPTGDKMYFRATGKAEQWDALHGTSCPCPVAGQSGGITELVYDGSEDNSALFVFSPGEPEMTGISEDRDRDSKTTIPIEGKWNIEIIPTMDNEWGDFRLPASEGKIGVEAREFTCSPKGSSSQPVTSVYGYAPYMKTLNIPSDRDLDKALETIGSAGGWVPYCFSWQYGVFDSPGSQGYHGLKEKVDDRFLILDQGCHQIFEAYLDVPSSGMYRLVRKGVEPYRVIIDGKPVMGDRVELPQGQHVLTVAYSETRKTGYELSKMRAYTLDTRDRSMVMLYPLDAPDPSPHGMYGDIVASSWYGTGFVPFVCKDAGAWQISFSTAPGTVSMSFETAGKIDAVEVGGKSVPFKEAGFGKSPDGHPTTLYKIDKLPVCPDVSTVRVMARPDKGYPGAAFFTEPVKMECSGGLLEPGDWSEAGAMKFFSGGVKYSKVLKITEESRQVLLDLGDVDATCEVSVNGKPVDVLLRKPYTLDVSKYVRKGENRIEVLVYSSLSNHYQTIPSPYKGKPRAGLIGPVQLILGPALAQERGDIQKQSDGYVWPTDPAVLQKLDEWQDLKFGVLMHWGIYSVKGIVESWGLCNEDWVRRPEGSVYEDYKKWYWDLSKEFNPVRFNPEQWADVFARAGMRYMIFTTKHHDGFCMFDSEYSDYGIAHGPFSADPRKDVAKYVFDAFRARDFMIGAYFSKPDWHHHGFWNPYYATPDRNPNYNTEKRPEWWKSYVEYTGNQLLELTTGKYGKIDILWLDGGWIRGDQVGLDGILPKARAFSPGMLCVDRTIKGPNENYRTPEQSIPKTQSDHPWESCITLTHSWGWAPNASFKSARKVIGLLAEITAKGGSLVLGVGPTPEGLIEDRAIPILEEIGDWLGRCGEAVYSTRITSDYNDGDIWFNSSKDCKTLYAIYALKDGEQLPETLTWKGNCPRDGKVVLLNNGRKLRATVKNEEVTLKLPGNLRQEPIALKYTLSCHNP